MTRRLTHYLVAATLLLAGTLPMAWAARRAQGRVRRLKACVAVIPTYGEPATGAPPANPFLGAGPDPDAVQSFPATPPFPSNGLMRSPNPNPLIFHVMNRR